MVRVSIDVEAANGVVAGMRAVVAAVIDEWSDAAGAAHRALVSTASLRGLADPLEEIGRLASELELRVQLAVLYNTDYRSDPYGRAPTQDRLEYEVDDDTLEVVKAQLGRSLAAALLAVDSTDAEGAEQLHRAAGLLGPYQSDPKVMSSFWAAAGPFWADTLPTFLAATGSETARVDLEVFSGAFATALHDVDPPEAFTDIAESFQTTPPDPGTAWNRLALLQFGDIPTDFLDAAARANGLDILRDGQAGTWDFRGSQSAARALELPEDTLALAFEALAHDDEAARLAISAANGTPEMVHLVYGYAAAFGSGDEVADAFGRAVEAGTGVHDEVMGRHSLEAAAFALEVITASAAHEDLPFSRTDHTGPVISAPHPGADVPWAVKDALAAIAASYAPELLAGANLAEHGTPFSTTTKPDDWTSFPGLEPAFYLSPEDTYAFLHTFGGDDAMAEPFDAAVGTLYQDLLEDAARHDAANGTQQFGRTAGLFGNLAGLEYLAQKDVRGDMDAFDQQVRDILATVVTFGLGKVPAPQAQAAALAWKAAVWGAKKGITAWRQGDPEATRVALLEDATLQAAFLQEVRLCQILIDTVPSHGATLPPALTAPGGGLIDAAEIAQDAATLDAFQDWLDHQDADGVEGTTDKIIEDANGGFSGGFHDTEIRFGEV